MKSKLSSPARPDRSFAARARHAEVAGRVPVVGISPNCQSGRPAKHARGHLRMTIRAMGAIAPTSWRDPGKLFVTALAVLIFLVAICLTGRAIAKPDCLTGKEYAERGGKLVHTKNIDFANPPPNFFCDRLACPGSVQFKGIVDSEGVPQNLRVTRNTWSDPSDPNSEFARSHALYARQRLAESRYAPLRIDRKPVCIKMEWELTWKLQENKEKP